jgi:hypothetical protein
MTQIEAIKYLISLLEKGNFKNYNEWGEAGLWHAVIEIMNSQKWTREEIEDLYTEAENN